MKITAFHQEYFCKKCGSPLGNPASAEYLQDEIYLYYVCLKCLVHHCTYFTMANFVSFPKDEAHLTKRAPDARESGEKKSSSKKKVAKPARR